MSNIAQNRIAQHNQRLDSQDRSDLETLTIIGTDETPGPDGIRWGLVHRIRAELAAGIYDDGEKWAIAETLLMESMQGRR